MKRHLKLTVCALVALAACGTQVDADDPLTTYGSPLVDDGENEQQPGGEGEAAQADALEDDEVKIPADLNSDLIPEAEGATFVSTGGPPGGAPIERVCDRCGKLAEGDAGLKPCPRCDQVRYCSQKCRKRHASHHKVCKPIAPSPAPISVEPPSVPRPSEPVPPPSQPLPVFPGGGYLEREQIGSYTRSDMAALLLRHPPSRAFGAASSARTSAVSSDCRQFIDRLTGIPINLIFKPESKTKEIGQEIFDFFKRKTGSSTEAYDAVIKILDTIYDESLPSERSRRRTLESAFDGIGDEHERFCG